MSEQEVGFAVCSGSSCVHAHTHTPRRAGTGSNAARELENCMLKDFLPCFDGRRGVNTWAWVTAREKDALPYVSVTLWVREGEKGDVGRGGAGTSEQRNFTCVCVRASAHIRRLFEGDISMQTRYAIKKKGQLKPLRTSVWHLGSRRRTSVLSYTQEIANRPVWTVILTSVFTSPLHDPDLLFVPCIYYTFICLCNTNIFFYLMHDVKECFLISLWSACRPYRSDKPG